MSTIDRNIPFSTTTLRFPLLFRDTLRFGQTIPLTCIHFNELHIHLVVASDLLGEFLDSHPFLSSIIV
jgi:hypothetical protein